MRHLIVMRHAKAERGDGKNDYDRALEPRGLDDADRVARALRERGLVPDAVLCSAARRTRDTLATMLAHFPSDCDVRLRRSFYEAEVVDLRDAVRTASGQCILLIGHNPSIHALALAFAGGAGEAFADGFPTANAAVFTMGFAIDTIRFDALITP